MEISLVDHRVSEVLIGYAVTIRFGPNSEFELQIEGDIEFTTADGVTSSVSSEDYESIATDLKALVGSAVTSSSAEDGSGLTVVLESGARIYVPVDEEYEAWGVVGPGGYRVICMPGGELAIWSARGAH
ncbi:DUF6188 family protein [Nocardia sp. NPDC051900]|uniref:DUF6188 family protein n=1 Tax=Nocardia sp. NPDC051900 TaxID=3364326 RepID=UPI0037949146